MGYGTPVIAHCSGGPLETIVNGETGFTIEKKVEL
jgi:glycosyltransferase involved in cell wall biosynthesis